MSAGSKTDVGAYHRDDSPATEENLADLQAGWGWGWGGWAALGEWAEVRWQADPLRQCRMASPVPHMLDAVLLPAMLKLCPLPSPLTHPSCRASFR